MTRDEHAAEVDDILREGGRTDALRRRILLAADGYAATMVEEHARTPLRPPWDWGRRPA